MNVLYRSLGILSLSLGLAACGSDDDDGPTPTPTPTPTPEANTVVDVAVDNGNFETLVELLQETGLDEDLDDPDGSFTVFAPTDDAFALLGEETLSDLRANPETLSDILLYHVISGAEVNAESAIGLAGETQEMANGDSVGLSLSGESLMVNLSMVTLPDQEADNGVIHVIDAVLMPPAERGDPMDSIVDIAAGDENFSTLVTALQRADLDTLLANEDETFTVFAPTNAAFESLGAENVEALLDDPEALSAVLLQHVVEDVEVNSINAYAANGTDIETAGGAQIPVSIENSALLVGGAEVVTADIYASNGVIHVIDSVITADAELPTPPGSIVDVAQENGNFDTLVSLLVQSGLDADLADTESEFTVFAPTDDAFAKVDQATMDALGEDADLLADVLTYHVASGPGILADAAIGVAESDSPFVDMVNGDQVGLSVVDGSLFVNEAQVVTPNVMASNGIIHALDNVIMPPAEKGEPMANIVETAIDAGNFTTLVEALQAANLDGALADESETYTVFAPTDAAFDKIPGDVLNALVGDQEALTAVLSNHVVADAEVDSVTAFTLNGTSVETLAGAMIPVEIADGMFMVGGSLVETYDVYASNGVIHVIDTVIVGDVELPEPPQSIVDVATEAGNFETLIAALDATGLDETLGNLDNDFTVFAPTDEAFAADFSEAEIQALLDDPEALENILLYHVLGGNMVADSSAATGLAGTKVGMANGDDAALSLSGEALLINLSQVVTPNVEADNGLIHAIDKVMMPPAAEGTPTDNIVETAMADGNFDTLVQLVTDAGLAGTLSDESRTFTVFAPTDAAFENVPQETMDALADDPALLESVLLTHVVEAQINSIDAYAANGTSVDTLSGEVAPIEIVNGELQVAGSTVVVADVYTTNGVIHAIDEVIIPE